MSRTSADPSDPTFFSFDEANRSLPLVRRIVEDITAEYRSGDPDDDRLRALVDELHELGCFFKGFGEGLVDWYSYYAGRPVLLCWKMGEPEIEWWHEVDAGFVGRQRILPTQQHAFRSSPGP